MLSQVWLMGAAFVMGLLAVSGLVGTDYLDVEGDEPASVAGFAVVELFTSQGCSSCPPADRVLASLSEDKKEDQPIYLLSFHVDYWNYLGWEDPYSLPVSTTRQKAYAKAWSSQRVYTPQMVVNGTYEFNGGNSRKARLAIEEGLEQTAQSTIGLRTSVNREANSITVAYSIEGATEDHLLNVALVMPRVENHVPRGENRGSHSWHVNVVRAFKSKRLDGAEGEIELKFPSDFDWKSGSAIAYVQRRSDAVLTGATAKTLK